MRNQLAELIKGHQSFWSSDHLQDGVPLLVGVDGSVWFEPQRDEPTGACVNLKLFAFMGDVSRCSREHTTKGGKLVIDELGVVVCGDCKEVLGFITDNLFIDGLAEPCSRALR